MPVRIAPNQIQNPQQIEAVVSGPDDANRLFVIDGQFDGSVFAGSQGSGFVQQKEIFSVLVGPVLTRKQFCGAVATASLAKTSSSIFTTPANLGWQILNVDADWDDESGQVGLTIEAAANCSGQNNNSSINGFMFHVTILATVGD
jgi:hydroxylamine reductase (hybrid-cluster protein)